MVSSSHLFLQRDELLQFGHVHFLGFPVAHVKIRGSVFDGHVLLLKFDQMLVFTRVGQKINYAVGKKPRVLVFVPIQLLWR